VGKQWKQHRSQFVDSGGGPEASVMATCCAVAANLAGCEPLFDVIEQFMDGLVGPRQWCSGGVFEMQPCLFKHLLEELAAELS
jgi:hypothetical protein